MDCIASPSRGISSAIRTIQQTMNACYKQNIPVDGIYGPRTTKAVKVAQKASGVKVDGIYGP